MRHLAFSILFIAFLFQLASCRPKYQKNSNKDVTIPFLIHILNKSHVLDYNDIDTSKKITNPQAFEIGIDTLSNSYSEEFYYVSSEKLLKSKPPGLDILIYFKVYYGGEQIDKILVVKKASKILTKVILAASGEQESVGNFTDDNTFILSTIISETIGDTQYSQIDSIDSTITSYKYDNDLNFKEVAKKNFKYNKRKGNPELDGKEFEVFGKPFIINGLKVQMRYFVRYDIYDEETDAPYELSKKITVTILEKELLDLERKKSLMKERDDYSVDVDFLDDIQKDETKGDKFDVNFDGFEDFYISCKMCGCANCDFSYIYLYNPKERTFKESKYLSGNSELQIDTVKRTVTSLFRATSQHLSYRIEKYNRAGSMEYVETFSMEPVVNKKGEQTKFQYRKERNNKVVKSKVEFFPSEKFLEFDSWMEKFN